MTETSINMDWERIHVAVAAIDSIRGKLGRVGLTDVFGGTYSPQHYESQGLPGLVRLVESCKLLREQAWRTVLDGSRAVLAANEYQPGDGWIWLSNVPSSKRVSATMVHRDYKAAERRARRWGGKVQGVKDPSKSLARKQKALLSVRDAVRVALHVRELFEAFEQSGVIDNSHPHQLCGQVCDSIGLTGLAHLRGIPCDGALTKLSECHRFINDPEAFVAQ